eukprot:6481633-Prymnesium_polylepis.2
MIGLCLADAGVRFTAREGCGLCMLNVCRLQRQSFLQDVQRRLRSGDCAFAQQTHVDNHDHPSMRCAHVPPDGLPERMLCRDADSTGI